MKQHKRKYDALLVSKTPLRLLRRNQEAVYTVRIKNTGTERWLDKSKLKQLRDDEKGAVVFQVMKDKSNIAALKDLKVMLGDLEGKTDIKFKNVYRSNNIHLADNQNRVLPGEIAEFVVRIFAKKFATKGLHSIDFRLVFLNGEEISSRVSLHYYIISNSERIKQYWRAARLKVLRPGKVAYIYSNNVQSRGDSVPIVMCVWQRLDNLAKTILSLEGQTGVNIEFYIWNNNPKIRKNIDDIVSKSTSSISIKVYHSSYNIGGYGRYYMSKIIAEGNFDHDKVIFIDDDQFPEDGVIKTLVKEHEPNSISSRWAHRFTDQINYWHKKDVSKEETPNYVGTCGMVCDITIFKDKDTFKCPKRFWFVEDLWLSFVAQHHKGWKLKKSSIYLPAVVDGKDQMTGLIDIKTDMLHYLLRKGWRPEEY